MAAEPPTKSKFAPAGFFALRTPLLPFSTLSGWSSGLRAPGALEGADLDAAVAADAALLVERLRAQIADPAVREALFVASPSLHEGIDAWIASPGDSRARGVVDVLLRYTTRMAARPTPFGLFSGCAVGRTGDVTRLELVPLAGYRRHTRLDVHYLSALCDELGRDETLRARLHYRPSNGLHRTSTQLRHAEASLDPKTRARSYALVSVERTWHLDAALARAERGATREQIAEAIVAFDAEVTLEEARGFVDSLVDGQIIVSNLSPVVTGPEPIDDLVATLRSHDAPAAAPLAAAGAAVRALDAAGFGRPASEYRAIAEALEALPGEPDIARLFQIDLYKPMAAGTLGKSVVRELTKAVELVARVSAPAEGGSLKAFREAFRGRYEDREVPLLDVLDEETGIGFSSGLASSSEPSPLLEGLPFPGDAASPKVSFGAREHHLQRRIGEALARGAIAWELDATDLEALANVRPPRVPDTFNVMAVIAAASCEAIDRGDFRVWWHGVAGASGAQVLGRFCHGDVELRAHVERFLRAEEALQPAAVFAEIVHLPDGRMGNILCRPVLRGHEIPYLGRSGAPEAAQIPVSDLFVSIAGERVVLRSARLGREVIPRMTTAHNTGIAALGVYRFLSALQSQDASSLGWSWGALDGSAFTPRVTHGRVVLAPARWTIHGSELKGASALAPAERYRRVQAMRAAHRLPRWVAVADGDNVLPLDLDNTLHVDTLATLAKHRPALALVEVAPGEEELVVSGPEGRFVHELVVPFVSAREPAATRLPRVPDAARLEGTPPASIARKVPPASDWLYAKIYTGTAAADAVLVNVVSPLLLEMREAGVCDRWFFIRYGDPDWHLRVRLHGEPARLVREALPRLTELARPWLEDGRVWKLQLDTYEREIERYGGHAGMELVEELFSVDSDAALAIVERLEPGEGNDARWRLALRGIHLLLVDLGLDLPTRARMMRAMREGYASEHNADAALDAALGARFRAERPALEALLAAKVGADHPLDPGVAVLEARSPKLAALGEALRAREKSGALTSSLAELARSFVHMHANRVLRSEQRTQELVLCDFLARLYESDVARSRPKKA